MNSCWSVMQLQPRSQPFESLREVNVMFRLVERTMEKTPVRVEDVQYSRRVEGFCGLGRERIITSEGAKCRPVIGPLNFVSMELGWMYLERVSSPYDEMGEERDTWM